MSYDADVTVTFVLKLRVVSWLLQDSMPRNGKLEDSQGTGMNCGEEGEEGAGVRANNTALYIVRSLQIPCTISQLAIVAKLHEDLLKQSQGPAILKGWHEGGHALRGGHNVGDLIAGDHHMPAVQPEA